MWIEGCPCALSGWITIVVGVALSITSPAFAALCVSACAHNVRPQVRVLNLLVRVEAIRQQSCEPHTL